MAHLHAFLAEDAPSALLLKRGPGALSVTIGWDRRTDEFMVGQWLRKRIDYRECDLSPDGEHFIYYVNDHSWSRENHVYRAVSRAPWLKALVFWGSQPRSFGPGVGMFFKERGVTRIRAPRVKPAWDRLGMEMIEVGTDTPRWRVVVHPESLVFTKLQRDGWIARTAWEPCGVEEAAGLVRWRGEGNTPHRIVFEKPLRHGWTLRRTCWCGGRGVVNRGIAWESFALVSATGAVEARPGWEWADVDALRGRLVWTEDCVLYGAEVKPAGIDGGRALFDTRGMSFEPRVAPYD